ncbi:unnamed protein product [Rotaria magnacalcarata]|uniref:Uncharacterized protein n=3 Tax=Rotaria magnacalcarata TaxID=392030 RepID=A0A816MK94_9BILA|nr:unnamed protein product [Rotaria magnacalcarata]
MLYRKEDIFRLDQHCSTIRNAVLYTIQEHKIKTADIGSTSTTTQFIGCALNGIVKMTSQIVFNYEIANIYQEIEVKQEANQSDRIDFDTGAEIDLSAIDTVPELLDRALSSNDFKKILKNSDSIFTSISNRQLDRLFSMRDSYKRVDRLVNCFPQKKTPIKRNRLQQNDLDDKESNSLKEEQQLKEKLCLFISYIKQLKEQKTDRTIVEKRPPINVSKDRNESPFTGAFRSLSDINNLNNIESFKFFLSQHGHDWPEIRKAIKVLKSNRLTIAHPGDENTSNKDIEDTINKSFPDVTSPFHIKALQALQLLELLAVELQQSLFIPITN